MFYFIRFIQYICNIYEFHKSGVLGAYNPDVEKVSAYECGFDPYEDARNAFDVRFYLVAIIFIIFDLEAAFFFPWCVSFSFLTVDGLWGMLDLVTLCFVVFLIQI